MTKFVNDLANDCGEIYKSVIDLVGVILYHIETAQSEEYSKGLSFIFPADGIDKIYHDLLKTADGDKHAVDQELLRLVNENSQINVVSIQFISGAVRIVLKSEVD